MPVLIRLLNIAKSPGMNTGLGMTNFGANLINKKSNRMDFCYFKESVKLARSII